MAGEKESVPASTGGIGQIDALVKLLGGGTKTTEKVSSDTSSLQTVLQQLLASSGDNQAVLDSIFAQAQAKIPTVLGNTYNASGSRAVAGTLSPQLSALQAQVTLAAQQQLAQQRQQALQTAAQVAGSISNANRTAVTKSGNAATGLVQQGGALLALNKGLKEAGIDVTAQAKKGWDWLSSIGDTDMGATAAPFAAVGGQFELPAASSFTAADGGGALTSSMADLLGFTPDAVNSGLFGAVDVGSSTPSVDVTSGISSELGTDTNFSLGSESALGSGPTTSGLNSSVKAPDSVGNLSSAIKLASYATDTKKRQDILDFSDGNWVDDVGDITDAASVFIPQAGLARGGLTGLNVFASTLAGDNNPLDVQLGQLTALAGQAGRSADAEDLGRTVGDSAGLGGPGAAIGDITQDIGNFFSNPGEGLKDLFGW